MSAVVADTHAVLWYLSADPRLSPRAREAMGQATGGGDSIFVPTICIVEATYLIEKNRVAVQALPQFALSGIPRHSIPDLPDRVIAATALALGLPLITRDGKIRASGIATIW